MDTIKYTIASATQPKSQKLFRLRGTVQDYEWGKFGSTSLAADLAQEGVGSDFKLDKNHPYAELWMSTHENGPASTFTTPSRQLGDMVNSEPEHYLGQTVLQRFPGSKQVPFVFKILSAGKALPLQAHPDKKLGEELHKRDPKQFNDTNHKPEIAVAIGPPVSDSFGGPPETAFLGFAGFQPLESIQRTLRSVPELQAAIGDELAVKEFLESPSQDTLKSIYYALLTRGKEAYEETKEHVSALFKGTGASPPSEVSTLVRLAKRVDEQYPGDVGVFAVPFFMNLFRLKKGEAIYVGADEVHAWFEGDIIECMAASDNVINSAFVPPEQRDVETFNDMLTYVSRDPSHWVLPTTPLERSVHGRTTEISPPLAEFEVLHSVLEPGKPDAILAARGPTIGIVASGSRVHFEVEHEKLDLPRGGIVFLAPGCDVKVSYVGDGETGGEVWWATTHDLE
ncbi:mannose-6-phosphate isomerase [Peniophora sp. CONT]|nr:mannose-6-phosphate isomerase [Peniophora sp. CONT]